MKKEPCGDIMSPNMASPFVAEEIRGESSAFLNQNIYPVTSGLLGLDKFLRKGLALSENIMRSQKLTSSIEKMKRKWGKNLFRADIGQPYDKDLEINKVYIDSVNKTAEQMKGEDMMTNKNYTGFTGIPELRKAYSNFYGSFWGISIDPESLLIGNGGSELMWATIGALFRPGDMIIAPDPHYNPFNVYLEQAGVGWLPIKTETTNGYHFERKNLEETLLKKPQGSNIKAIYLCSPNNPTGTVYSKNELDLLVDLALRHDLLIITDDVYALYNDSQNLTFPKYLESLDTEKKAKIERLLISFDSMSKLAHVPGIRKGFARIPNSDLREAIGRVLGTRGNPDNFNQLVATNMLDSLTIDNQPLVQIQERYKQKMDLVYEKMQYLKKLGIEIPDQIPDGNFYITIKTPFITEDFIDWVANYYNGPQATTFTPIATTSGSFRADPDELQRARTELRFCLGLDIQDIEPAINALIDQIRVYTSTFNKN